MKQRGRVSSAALATVATFPVRLLEPPEDLTSEEATVWAHVTATKPGDWWDAGSMPLLAQYCRAVVQSDTVGDLVRTVLESLQTDPDELVRYRELRKIQTGLSNEIHMLARSMRLTQLSRIRAEKVIPKSNNAKPWSHDVIDA